MYCIFCSGDFKIHFSDLDTSDDDERGENTRNKRTSMGDSSKNSKHKVRVKECPGCGAMLPTAMKECSHCDYLFTSKSMLVTAQSSMEESQSIRDKFPFEPERV